LSNAGVISAKRWRENWRAAAADNAVHVELPRRRSARRAALAYVRSLSPGTSVVLSTPAPAAASRCRAFARAAGLQLEREYLAFPTAAAPAYLVEDGPAAVRLFLANVLVAPPRARFSLVLEPGLAALRRLRSWHLLRLLAPGRVAVGRRA